MQSYTVTIYDLVGNRVHETSTSKQIDATTHNLVLAEATSTTSTYDDLNRLTERKSDNPLQLAENAVYAYDGASRVVASVSYFAYHGDQGRYTPQYRYTQFDATGKAEKTRMVERGLFGGNYNAPIQISTVDYGGGYDLAGNLLHYSDTTKTFTEAVVADKRITTTVTNTNAHQNGQVHQSQVVTSRTVQQWDAGSPPLDMDGHSSVGTPAAWVDTEGSATVTATNTYDANGFLVRHSEGDNNAQNRSFVNNAQGMAVYVNQGANSGGHLANPFTGFVGGYTGSATDPGNAQRQFIVGGQVLARYGHTSGETGTDVAKGFLDAGLSASAATLGASAHASSYVTQRGETLQTVARAVYGDARLWYRLADANGLTVSCPHVRSGSGAIFQPPFIACHTPFERICPCWG